jgi:hypothetical protein
VSKRYVRYWSSIWFALACPVVLAAVVVWSWIGVSLAMGVAFAFSSVILGSAPNPAGHPHPAFGGIPWRRLLGPALRWATIAVAVVMTTVFSPWLGFLVLLALFGTSPWAVHRLRGRVPSVTEDVSTEHIRRLVRQLDVAGLCWAWRSSHDLLHQVKDVEARSRVVTLRQEYLDEMERRDASGFQAWLAVARAAEDPEAYLSDPGDPAAA